MILVLKVLFIGLSGIQTLPLGEHIISAILFGVAMIFIQIGTKGILLVVLSTLRRQSCDLFFLHLLFMKIVFTLVVSSRVFEFEEALIPNIFVSIFLSWMFSRLVFERIDRCFVELVRVE